jgi:Terminase large subunit, T4likevirus-type, N-terminal
VIAAERHRIRPHPGPQERFLSTRADICFYGGAAGAGKSFGLLLHPLRHVHVRGFTCECFRQTTGQVRNPGSIWDEARSLYSQLGAWMRDQELDATWPSGARVKFGYLDHASDRYSHQGSQICMLLFDELTLVGRGSGPTREAEEARAEATFWYMLSRNRSTCGVTPCCRGTVNPDAASWVAKFIAWWIDQATGYPIPERSGVLRWFYRLDGKVCWFDSREEAEAACPELAAEGPPKSFTFIAAKLEDNPTLQAKDPGYRSNLMAQEPVEGARLLAGNWRVREVVPGAPIFTFSGSLEDDCPRAARSRLVYDEEDDRWAAVGGPAQARASLISCGAWDFGSGPSMLVCGLALVELPPADQPNRLPRIWLDDECWWYAEKWIVAAADVRQRIATNGYGHHVIHGGDPTGKSPESDQGSWESNLRAGGIPLQVLDAWCNTQDGREWLIRYTQALIDSGNLIVHQRCRKVLGAIREWRRDLPRGVVLEGLDLERIKPKHDVHSHPGMMLLYLVSLVLACYREWMGEAGGDDEQPVREILGAEDDGLAVAVPRFRL